MRDPTVVTEQERTPHACALRLTCQNKTKSYVRQATRSDTHSYSWHHGPPETTVTVSILGRTRTLQRAHTLPESSEQTQSPMHSTDNPQQHADTVMPQLRGR